MATFGTLNVPYVLSDLGLVVTPMPELVTPYDVPGPDGLGGSIVQRFPVPPAAFGFLWDSVVILGPLEIDHVEGRIVAGALAPFNDYYLEPTTGQIWPRG